MARLKQRRMRCGEEKIKAKEERRFAVGKARLGLVVIVVYCCHVGGGSEAVEASTGLDWRGGRHRGLVGKYRYAIKRGVQKSPEWLRRYSAVCRLFAVPDTYYC
jgi:hypothetical protein